ncbi:DMT family transporter [uncultured Alsobacter sp.]|uniref:DMT family transporter n=1 Tax=uncultured Alsobacter sp. TaxID=1748258 RepID=UPI0025FDFE50|nr:DMT family transporter [uncultured Alsobacter sp.]
MLRIAATLLITAAFFGTIEATFIRLIGDRLGLGQMLVFRSGAQVLLVCALGGMFTGKGVGMLRTHRLKGHLARGSLAAIVWYCTFMNFRSLDMPLATTLSFSSQLFILLLAWPVIGERITREKAAMAGIGFLGVVVAVELWNPSGLDWRISYGLTGSCLGALMILITRSLSLTEKTETIMFYMAFIVFLSAVPQAALDWRPIDSTLLAELVMLSVFGTTGTFFMVEAYRRAEASALAPFPYSRFIFAVAFGHMVFGDPIKTATIAGAALIALSNVLPVLRARRAAARRRVEKAPGAAE